MSMHLILGSKGDKGNGNIFLKELNKTGTVCVVSIGSCHRHIGGEKREFENFIAGIRAKIIGMLGGLELAAPGIIESLERNARKFDKIVLAIPTDKAARSAIENLPRGTAIITCGLNEIDAKHSIINSALIAAKLAGMLSGDQRIIDGLQKWYDTAAEENPLVEKVELVDGLIP